MWSAGAGPRVGGKRDREEEKMKLDQGLLK